MMGIGGASRALGLFFCKLRARGCSLRSHPRLPKGNLIFGIFPLLLAFFSDSLQPTLKKEKEEADRYAGLVIKEHKSE